jgi:hypothetical protein
MFANLRGNEAPMNPAGKRFQYFENGLRIALPKDVALIDNHMMKTKRRTT